MADEKFEFVPKHKSYLKKKPIFHYVPFANLQSNLAYVRHESSAISLLENSHFPAAARFRSEAASREPLPDSEPEVATTPIQPTLSRSTPASFVYKNSLELDLPHFIYNQNCRQTNIYYY